MDFDIKNFSVDIFNRDVNQSGDLEAKYHAWSQYRKVVSSYVEFASNAADGHGEALVLGAGNLNDLDVGYLLNRFKKVVLTDTDIRSIKEGIARQSLKDSEIKRIEIASFEYTGALENNLFNGLVDLAKKMAPVADITNYLDKSISKLALNQRHLPINRKFDLVVSCPIYTQLLYTQIEVYLKILHEYGIYEMRDLNAILNAAYRLMPEIIKRYNDMIMSLCADRASILLLSDIIEMEAGSELQKRVKSYFGNEGVELIKIQKEIEKNGIELAQIGIDDFSSKADVSQSFYTLWPFDETKEYLVYALIAKNSN